MPRWNEAERARSAGSTPGPTGSEAETPASRVERYVGWSLLYAALYFALSYVIHADDSSILRQVVRALIVGFVGTALTLRSNALRKRGIEPYHPGLTLTIGLVMFGAGTWCLLGSSPRATGWISSP